jgi:hypothetical protein
MFTSVLLRVASGLSLLFAAGHLMGGLKKWSPMGPNRILAAMTDVRFQTLGVSRSYADFFMGFGWSIGVAMLLQAVLLWQLSGLAREHAARTRPMIAAFAAANLASALIAWRFLFPIPALFSLLVLVSLVAAYLTAR